MTEGDSQTYTASVSDPGVNDNPTVAWDCDGDGFDDGSGSSVTCSFPDGPATVAVSAQATDKDGGVGAGSVSLNVANVAPTLGLITLDQTVASVDTPINFTLAFTDPGVLDTHTADWAWGDGSTTAGTVIQGEGSGSVADSHAYNTPGIYTIGLTVSDDDGAVGTPVFEFVVVYDPAGGFVTGGGWIDSPAGACQFGACTDNTGGKATFGFVSRYKKGSQSPSGETQFQFKAGDLKFDSDSYDWLVVAGARAQYKGSGVINGGGNYGFMLTAIDAGLNDNDSFELDRFRIKIWDKENGDTLVYDNQVACSDGSDDADPCTEIQGGSIVIHTGKKK